MRPVHRPPAPADMATFPLPDLLLQALGVYCSLCERRLNDTCWGWNARKRRIAGLRAQPAEWDQLLPVCHNCREAAQASQSSAPLLLPDRALTFRLAEDSPFIYRLETIEQVLLDDDGRPLGAPETVERVIVEGTTPEAQATIAYFTLNTRYYDPSTRSMRVTRAAALAALDRRVDLRTKAWWAATEYVEALRQARGAASLRSLLALLKNTIADQGYWSTWATVLWQGLQDRSLLARVLMPPASSAAPVMDGEPAFAGQALSFRATRSDWLA